MADLVSKAKVNTMKAFEKMLDREQSVKKNKFYLEAEDDELKDETTDAPDTEVDDDVNPEKEPYDLDDEGKDTLDNVDDLLEKIDVASLDNDIKVELITSIIDSIQNSTESDDEFSEIMNQISDVVEGYKFENEGEEEAGEELEGKGEELEEEGAEEVEEGKEEEAEEK
jgi:hypothetical protein